MNFSFIPCPSIAPSGCEVRAWGKFWGKVNMETLFPLVLILMGLSHSVDAVLKPQDNSSEIISVDILFGDLNKFEPGSRLHPEQHGTLIAQDLEGPPDARNYSMKSVNDTKGLLEYDLNIIQIPPQAITNISGYTIVYPKIKLSENVTKVHRWNGSYCVAADLVDSDDPSLRPPVRYVVCMGWGKDFHFPGIQEQVPEIISKNHFPEIKQLDVENEVQYNGSVDTSVDRNPLTSTTILYTTASFAIVILILVTLMLSWKKKGSKKRMSGQLAVIDVPDMELSNGFGDHGGTRILRPDSVYASSGLNDPRFTTNALFNPDNFFQIESKWEISREDLRTEHVLGEGEFGRVLKGVMRTVSGNMHVAVKMLKIDHTDGSKSMRQEFMAEFSLLKQLDHTNVIKLLGASTSIEGPPLLVMEYAEFGSLRSFLRKCRRVEKINQGCDNPEWNEVGWNDNSHLRNSAEHGIRASFGEYHVTPQEVLGFSWQIAKGMAYLSDMKMVHRDLAARNVLLTKTKVCKISDFGLTRDIYVDDAYKKKSKDRVPVKWLAPECLTDELYTSKSDVWAFGILLWELTTLGASPYPGIQTELLYSLLDAGYRMPQPTNCSNEVYSIMNNCWEKNPVGRPTFHELVLELSRLLENGIEYLKLDFSVFNPGYGVFNPTEIPQPIPDVREERPTIRRNSSMENLRLIDYEISTNDNFGSLGIGNPSHKHTYVNEPQGLQDCSETNDDHLNSSGYESPITLSISTG